MTYRTSVSDPFLRLQVFLVTAFVGMVAVLAMIGLYSLWLVLTIYVLVMVGLSYFLMKLLSCAVVETELLQDRIRIRWIQQSPLARRYDEDILFTDIKEDGFMTSRVQKVYTLFLKDGREFTYNEFVLYSPRHQDLETMGRDIRDRIEVYHENNPEPWMPQGYEKNKPEPAGQGSFTPRVYLSFLFVVAIYFMVGFPVLKMTFPDRPLIWDLKVLAIATSLFLLLAKVLGSALQRSGEQADEE